MLAGGAGRRLGGGKAIRDLHGTPLVERAIALLRSFCGEIVVAGRPDAPLPAGLQTRVVYDEPAHAGPVAGIAAGLAALDAEDVVILACDLPLAGPAVARLAAHPPGRPAVAVAPDGPQPLCARVPRRDALVVADRLLAEGAPAARALISALGADPIECPAAWLANVNTPEDARHAEALIALGTDAP